MSPAAAPTDNSYYVVYTDLDPQALGQASLAIYERWVAFAMGHDNLSGLSDYLMHPTGRYASAITIKQYNPYRIAIIADAKKAPEAVYIEEGHDRIDLLTKYPAGKRLAMHRGGVGEFGSAGYGPPIRDTSRSARHKNIWAEVKAFGSAGYVTVPSKRPPGMNTSGQDKAWVIPRMRAYSPAAHLIDLYKQVLTP